MTVYIDKTRVHGMAYTDYCPECVAERQDEYEPYEEVFLCDCNCGCFARVGYEGERCPMCAEACFYGA